MTLLRNKSITIYDSYEYIFFIWRNPFLFACIVFEISNLYIIVLLLLLVYKSRKCSTGGLSYFLSRNRKLEQTVRSFLVNFVRDHLNNSIVLLTTHTHIVAAMKSQVRLDFTYYLFLDNTPDTNTPHSIHSNTVVVIYAIVVLLDQFSNEADVGVSLRLFPVSCCWKFLVSLNPLKTNKPVYLVALFPRSYRLIRSHDGLAD